jgi:hypothetical protein
MDNFNHIPIPDFDGFSPVEMHKIIYSPFDDDCPIKINILNSGTLINQSPILKIIIGFISNIGEAGLKLTPKGNLPIKVMKDIYNLNVLPDEYIENDITHIRTETDWPVLHIVRIVLTMAGLIRVQKNKLLLTKKCENLRKGNNYSELFYTFMKTFTLEFSWAYNDRYANQDIGQIAFLYSLYLINKYGDEFRDLDYFTNRYFAAFPSMLSNPETELDKYSMRASSYNIRFIERFALWFGFVEEVVEGIKYSERRINIRRTKLLQELLQVKSATIFNIYSIN